MKFGIYQALSDLLAVAFARFSFADLSIFHDFDPPPSGGGHQFLRGFWKQAEAYGLRVENNRISRTTQACLFNSFNFKERRLSWMRKKSVLYVHRVDGPIDVYRGYDGGVDYGIHTFNKKYADKTIFQSHYSLEKHLERGLEFKNPVVIQNAADPDIFHSYEKKPFSVGRKTRLIATSWSDNINKGSPFYKWLDENLDWNRFEFTFVGNSPIKFKNIKIIPPVTSYRVAEILREHDIYITASKHESCSNSLIEALSCGLPAIFLVSGGNPEIVKQAGIGFETAYQIPDLLDMIVSDYDTFQKNISIPSLDEVSKAYLKVLELV